MTIWQDIQRRVGVDPDGVPGDATAKAVAMALGLGAEPHRALASPLKFFEGIRKITGPLDSMQVAIINDLIATAAHWSIGWLAYGLATAWHEARLRPVEEIGKGRGHKYGNVNVTGKAPYGRGLVQLTWDSNYAHVDEKLGLGGTLAKNYDRALEPDIAVKILVRGMEEGWFTGRKLADTITSPAGSHKEFLASRPIINVMDKAELIAGYADDFKEALIAGGWA